MPDFWALISRSDSCPEWRVCVLGGARGTSQGCACAPEQPGLRCVKAVLCLPVFFLLHPALVGGRFC